jgi:tight adherence protein C
MTMIAVIAVTTFACVTLLVMSLFWFYTRPRSILNTRLDQMAAAAGPRAGSGHVAALAGRVAAPISRIVPLSAKESDRLQRRLFRAGYASPDAPLFFRAAQLVTTFLLPALVLMTFIFLDYSLKYGLVWGAAAACVGFYLPRYALGRMIHNRRQRITWGLADALDLLVISVEAGLGLNAALVRVSEELRGVHPDIYDEFETVNLEIRVGRSREEALRNLAERTGVDDLRSFVALLIQADRYGSSIGRAVRVFADSLRTKRRQRAEQTAQKASLKLLFPLTFFLFPAVVLIILGPSVLNIVDLLAGR